MGKCRGNHKKAPSQRRRGRACRRCGCGFVRSKIARTIARDAVKSIVGAAKNRPRRFTYELAGMRAMALSDSAWHIP
ncbi:hypothetical protein BIWAKO_04323 [Bosea sp. BIWAKO-01]|nr:hypothetical protein BIWAKO_04323 [Bosea sp. BIWAKO-01]